MRSSKKILILFALLLGFSLVLSACSPTQEQVANEEEPKGDPVTIRFFLGGDPGNMFSAVIQKGAEDAAKALGDVKLEFVYSGWQPEKMVSQLREAIAANPDGIAMMGHPGDDAIIGLAEEAHNAGIIMTYMNVDVPEVRSRFGGGYIGAQLLEQGVALGEKAIQQLNLQSGDRAAVFGYWGMPGRYFREEGVAQAFEKQSVVVDRITIPVESTSDPQLLIPIVTAQLGAVPDTKVLAFAGGETTGTVQTYLDAAGKKPGEVYAIGFDLSPAIFNALEKGYLQITSDQQPYLQGYLPVISIYLTKKYGFSLLSYNTGAGFVTSENFGDVKDLVEKGVR
ncbi:MAG: substrate-binding domain-containing protein [Bacillota bacterium]